MVVTLDTPAARANQLMHELVGAINARVQAPPEVRGIFELREAVARQRYNDALSEWLGGRVKA